MKGSHRLRYPNRTNIIYQFIVLLLSPIPFPLFDPQFCSPFVPAANRGVLGGLADPRTTLRRAPPDGVPPGGAIQGDGAGVRALPRPAVRPPAPDQRLSALLPGAW